jgi:aspartate racemase
VRPQHLPIGVIGGLGPAATASFLDRVIRATRADRDQDHLDMVILNHATIPDRTAYITGASHEDPGPVMAEDARRLERFGVSFLVMPCNTAQYFTDEVAAAVDVPLLSIVEETVTAVCERRPQLHCVGVLATDGTVQAGVYQDALAAKGLDCVLPNDAEQATLMEIIYGEVKSGRPVDVDAFEAVCSRLFAVGAQVLVIGCTELSVVVEKFGLLTDPRLVDSLDALAHGAIVRAGHQVRTDAAPVPSDGPPASPPD